jgi:hypothetical protein|tara:strand:+ start:5728 stop:5967 length:240 start_codon:yes stop_codon:yes gene_type:complete
MLPKHHYNFDDSSIFNDSGWIGEQIDMLPISMQKKVASKYSDIYLKLTNEKDKKARFRSNSWLRKTVDKYKVTNKEGLF